jgi:hypothetical protein
LLSPHVTSFGLVSGRGFAAEVELENAGNHDNGLRPLSVLKHCKPDRLGTIDEESAAKAARILNNPVPRLFWPIRKREDLELEGCSARLMAIVLDDDWTRVVCGSEAVQLKLSQQIA